MNNLTSVLQPFVDRGLIAGAVVLAATKDRILAHEAVGYADLATKKPMTPDSLFWIASMTKPMTGTALMMLVDEGKVNVDDPVEKYLPEFKGQMVIAEKDDDHVLLKKPAHPITVREILTHTSGLAFVAAIEKPALDQFPLRDAVHVYTVAPLNFEPGTQYCYSNQGTNTCGRIIEVVSGRAYEDFMDERLFHPLGMKDTTFWPNDEQVARFAKIYSSKEDKSGLEETQLRQLTYPFTDRAKRYPMPAGGLFSTAADCLKFCRMVLNGGEADGRRYLSKTAVGEMTRKQTSDLVEKAYGFGWEPENGKFGHGGAYKTKMIIDPARGLITIFLLHHTNDWHHDDGKEIHPAVFAASEMLL
jgi:CubicO group peptidase (beta-lactamase class C family)